MSEVGQRMVRLVREMQDEITTALTAIDPVGFREDSWERDGGGGGWSRVLQDGEVFEKAGVNVSEVYGELSPQAAASMGGGAHIDDLSFFATGVSLVLHPHNPMAPTVHANYRYFERGDGSEPGSWWFGGGSDLTPAYLFDEDARHFHDTHKAALDRHDVALYPRFKTTCDEYFYLPHRKEARGVGGIFYDNFTELGQEGGLALARTCGSALLDAYLPIIERRKDAPFTDANRTWQQIRRGRYVEFNLVWDRGTAFGLRTDGRTESILMSLPLTARWEYGHEPEPGTEEARVLEVLRHPQDWATS